MQALDDMALLREYAASNSEAAFETLVSRRVNFVYSAAMRQVRDPHLAGEITQAVFIILAQKAGRITDRTNLTGWLFTTTRFTALAQLRALIKRQRREQEAQMQSELQTTTPDPLWEQMSPLLDEALAALGETDRQAVLLRFFENQSLAEVGNSLGAGEDTTRKRVTRALEKLRKFFTKRGVALSGAAIASALATNSVQAAPAILATSLTAVAITKGAATSASTLVLAKGALKLMAWAKAQMAIVVGTAVVLAAGTTTVVVKELVQKENPAPVEALSPIDEFLSGNMGSSSWLDKAPPALLVRPTRFPNTNGGAIWQAVPKGSTLRAAGRNQSFESLMTVAYGFDSTRMIPPDYLPRTNFDFMATLPDCSRKAFQDEIEKEVGFVAHPEMREMNVLLLKVKIPDAPGLRPGKATDRGTRGLYGGNVYHATSMPISDLREFLESTIFHQPVIDQTGLTNKYDITLDWEEARYPIMLGSLREVLLEQLGLELVPARERIEMLVIEPAKDSAKAALLKEVSTSSTEASLWNQPNLALLPPVLILRPTRFDPEPGFSHQVTHVMGQLRMRLQNQPLEYLLAAACDFKVTGRTRILPSRMIQPPNLPKERYDLLLTVPDGLEALQKEIRKQLHLTVRREVREVDALVIKHAEASAPEGGTERRATATNPIISPHAMTNLPLWIIAQNIEAYQGKPVLVKTASTNRFNLSIEPIIKNQKLVYDDEVLKRAFHDQLGLDIVPSREKIEMLVVEQSKN